jgi:hypothetical protein
VPRHDASQQARRAVPHPERVEDAERPQVELALPVLVPEDADPRAVNYATTLTQEFMGTELAKLLDEEIEAHEALDKTMSLAISMWHVYLAAGEICAKEATEGVPDEEINRRNRTRVGHLFNGGFDFITPLFRQVDPSGATCTGRLVRRKCALEAQIRRAHHRQREHNRLACRSRIALVTHRGRHRGPLDRKPANPTRAGPSGGENSEDGDRESHHVAPCFAHARCSLESFQRRNLCKQIVRRDGPLADTERAQPPNTGAARCAGAADRENRQQHRDRPGFTSTPHDRGARSRTQCLTGRDRPPECERPRWPRRRIAAGGDGRWPSVLHVTRSIASCPAVTRAHGDSRGSTRCQPARRQVFGAAFARGLNTPRHRNARRWSHDH